MLFCTDALTSHNNNNSARRQQPSDGEGDDEMTDKDFVDETIDAVELAAKGGLSEAEVLSIVNAKDVDLRRPLHWVCSKGRYDLAKFLVSNGADVNVTDEDGWTPLHCAASRGDADCIDLLLTSQANVNSSTKGNLCEPLHYAASKGHIEAVEMLVTSKANLNTKDKLTPLGRAVSTGRINVVSYLIKMGADVMTQDKFAKDTVLHIAVNNQDLPVCELLLQKDPRLATITNAEGHTALAEAPRELRAVLQMASCTSTEGKN